ncbi:MAG: DNA translocase FtsK 4TM domain-containing protein [Rhodobacteraceae bacterium]|nr:DNA translocase FtsK 4TM domain-containing protein [Paracoccaceae bacterium]
MTYHTGERDPLLDPETRAFVMRRLAELGGIAMLIFGLLVAVMALSYSPEDPNWMVTTDAPVRNWLGSAGAQIAAPVFMVIGWGCLSLALLLLGWGLRFVLHSRTDRFLGRMVFAPFAIASMSVYASTLVPDAGWAARHHFGLGGQFGDMVSHALLILLPITSAAGIKAVSAVAALVMVALHLFVMGVTWQDLRRGWAQFLHGLHVVWLSILTLLGRSAQAGHARWQARQAEREARLRDQELAARAAQEEAEDALTEEWEDYEDDDDTPEPAPRLGLLARVASGLTRKEPEPPLPEPELIQSDGPEGYDDMPGEERIQAKIASAIRARRDADTREADPIPVRRAEPPLHAAPDTVQDVSPEPNLAEPDIFDEAHEDDLVDVPATARPYKIPVAQPRVAQVDTTPPKPTAPSRRAKAEAQPSLAFEDADDGFALPPLSLLTNPITIERHDLSEEALQENARLLENVLDDYGVKGDIVSVRPGPVVTMYELEPAPGLKASRVIGLADDIARSMSALSARVSTVPGRSVIGIELPNVNREKVVLREILSSRDFGDSNLALPLALGKDIGGAPMVANLAKMPHLLIAGTTGSGKSVAINTMILSLLYKLTPEDCRLIMIDPKMLELSVYDGIPHLLSPVVTDPKKAVVALKWVVGEMEDRYRKMSKMGVRNIGGYNGRVQDAMDKGEMFSRTVQTGFDDETGDPIFETEEFEPEKLPYIVVIVDEMADLMMVAGKEIEACIQRLAQMARASGIHLIMATQRPSVDVITGTIKANFPTRISFQVTSKVDSRTILGEMGAEQLLGMGDMLYMAGGAKITRCHGPFVSDEEVEEIVNHLKAYGPPDYISTVVEGPDDDRQSELDLVLGLGGNTNGEDALYDQAVAIVAKDRKCSTSYIQRKLGIGYNKAARLVEQMEDEGLVTPANHVGKREILVPEAS